MMGKRLFTREQERFVRENVEGRSVKDMTALINRTFEMNLQENQIRAYMKNHWLTNGINATFKKGQVPHNKGKKMPDNGKPTWFKKGHKPMNWAPIGSERVNGDGYVDVKVADGKLQHNWRAKHVLTWEEHNGPLPKGHAIIFGDGNNRNFDIENLICVTRADLARLNKGIKVQKSADLTRAAITTGELISKIRNRKQR